MTEKYSKDQVLIQKLITIIEINIENEKFGVAELASETGLSRSQLHRRLKDINGKSTSQFIREYRLQKAMEMLKLNQATASEIAYRVGFSSPTYFNTCFHNFYGYPPGEVKFQKSIAPPKKTLSKTLLSIIPLIILIGLIVFSETSSKNTADASNIEKTIAVLPFVNNSPNKENMYFCNGIMAGIRDHLAKIPEFSVVSRRTAEQYRNTTSPLKTIAKELDVNYVIEGHVQRIGDRAIISVEFIRVNDNKIIWSDSYDEDVSQVFAVQASVIQSITTNLETIISSSLNAELKTAITQDTLAYDHFLKGQEYSFKADRTIQQKKFWLDLINKAQLSFELSIERDSLFAKSYMGLAHIVFEKKSSYGLIDSTYTDKDFMTLIDKTLQLNPNLSDAYLLKGNYYYEILNDNNTAIVNLEKAMELAPNKSSKISILNRIYHINDNRKGIVSILKKREQLARSKTDKIAVYDDYAYYYMFIEAYDMSEYYYKKISEIDSSFRFRRYWFYVVSNQLDEAILYLEQKCPKDSHMRNGLIGAAYLNNNNNNKALEYLEAWQKQVTADGYLFDGSILHFYQYGRALINDGQKEKGLKILNKQLEILENALKSKQKINPYNYLLSTEIYKSLGQDEKAYESIDKFEEVNGWFSSQWVVLKRREIARSKNSHLTIYDDPYIMASFKRGEKQLVDLQKQIRPYLPSTPIKRD